LAAMRWKGYLLVLYMVSCSLAFGKLFALEFSVFHVNWVAASFWSLALLVMVCSWRLYGEASLSYFDNKSGRHKPCFSKQLLARFASRSMAISAIIFLVGCLVQAYS